MRYVTIILPLFAVLGIAPEHCFLPPAAAQVSDGKSYVEVPVGKTFYSHTEDGQRLLMRVTGIEKDPLDQSGELSLYAIDYFDEQRQSWSELCLADREGRRAAIPLRGYWTKSGEHVSSDSVNTFACTVGVLAKCVRWGYHPWKTVRGVPLGSLHQACTRMARADYCGNGVGHTKEGTEIDIFDTLGIQVRSNPAGMVFEAAWDENGATYLSRPRWSEISADLLRECPEKLAGRVREHGDPLSPEEIRRRWPSTLLFNASYPR